MTSPHSEGKKSFTDQLLYQIEYRWSIDEGFTSWDLKSGNCWSWDTYPDHRASVLSFLVDNNLDSAGTKSLFWASVLPISLLSVTSCIALCEVHVGISEVPKEVYIPGHPFQSVIVWAYWKSEQIIPVSDSWGDR